MFSTRARSRADANGLTGLGRQGADEAVVDVFMHIETLGRGAHLTAVEEGGEGGATGDDLHGCGGHDDKRIIARGFDQHRLEAQRGALRHCLTGRHTASEGHGMGVRVRHQMATNGGAAGQALHQSGRQMIESLHDQ
jgi:hypothetical protein